MKEAAVIYLKSCCFAKLCWDHQQIGLAGGKDPFAIGGHINAFDRILKGRGKIKISTGARENQERYTHLRIQAM